MRQPSTRTLGGIVAAAGLILAMPCAQAVDTYYYNLTGQIQTDLITYPLPPGEDPLATSATINSALFIGGADVTGTVVGTGVLQPFVRIQNLGDRQGACGDPCIESGYNTNGTEQFETKDAGAHNWTHAIQLTEVGKEGDFRVFVLDINESHGQGGEMLSLDKLRIYLSSSDSLSDYRESAPDCAGYNLIPPAGCTDGTTSGTEGFYDPAGAWLVYNMDAGHDATVGLDYSLNHGSGKGVDLVVKIPEINFTNAISASAGGLDNINPYVYLYSAFGATGLVKNNGCDLNGTPPYGCAEGYLPQGNYGSNAGFEEWSTLKGVPEPMSIALLLVGLAAIGFTRRQQPSPVAC